MNPLFKLFGIGEIFSGFDEKIRMVGWSAGCQWLMENLGLVIHDDLRNFPRKGSVLIYSNHPTGLDPFILGAAIGREDYVFLGDLYQTKKGQHVAAHIVPTASSGFWREFFSRRPTNWPGYINMRLSVPPVGKSAALNFNYSAIQKVVKHLSNGGAAAIFPSGGEYEFLPWKSGLSKIIIEARKKGISFKLYRVRIQNFSEIKLIMHFLSGKKLFRKLTVTGYPVDIDIKKEWFNLNPDKLTSILKCQ